MARLLGADPVLLGEIRDFVLLFGGDELAVHVDHSILLGFAR